MLVQAAMFAHSFLCAAVDGVVICCRLKHAPHLFVPLPMRPCLVVALGLRPTTSGAIFWRFGSGNSHRACCVHNINLFSSFVSFFVFEASADALKFLVFQGVYG